LQIIEECVALVGVDLNTACEAVLRRVPGLNKTIAKALVGKRADVGRFTSRGDLLKIAGIGKRKFQDAVGFTRVFPTAGAKFSKAEVVYVRAPPRKICTFAFAFALEFVCPFAKQ
jgi:hypothetical protein